MCSVTRVDSEHCTQSWHFCCRKFPLISALAGKLQEAEAGLVTPGEAAAGCPPSVLQQTEAGPQYEELCHVVHETHFVTR